MMSKAKLSKLDGLLIELQIEIDKKHHLSPLWEILELARIIVNARIISMESSKSYDEA